MVAAAATTTATPAAASRRLSAPKPPDPRPPLAPSEKSNAAVLRKPRTKEIASRYLSSHSSSSSSTSNSTSATSNSTSRRFPSPLLTPRPSTPPPSKPRSHSVDRSRPSTPSSAASRTLTTTTRSLSVSFQGESFFYQTRKAKPPSDPPRKPSPDRRRPFPTSSSSPSVSENSKPFDRWPAARSLTRSLDCSSPHPKDPIAVAAVRLLHHSSLVSLDAAALDSDTDSSNSGGPDAGITPIPLKAKVTPRGISVPARFWQETNSRLRRLPEPGMRTPAVKRLSVDSPVSSPRSSVGSPIRGPVRPASPSKLAGSPSRGSASPMRVRGSSGLGGNSNSVVGQPGNAPSIISFAAEVRRASKGEKGENRIEEAHMLRLLHNRHLQWRCVNARANAALMAQRLVTEKNLYNAWITSSELHDSVTIKRIKLQILTQHLKLTSILKGQMTYLEEWSHMERDHSNSLSGAIEALKASTLRLPVVGGARADLQEVKDAVGSAVDVMQAMGSSICSLLSKVEGTSSLVSELAKAAAQERALMDQSRDLLSMVAALHVKQCSLRGHILQLKCRSSQMQL